MADITVKVLEEAQSYALITLDELKLAIGIDPANTDDDEQLQMWIDHFSDVIATMCNRVFAKEKVEETWRGDPPPYENYRIFLTHYPVEDGDIERVTVADAEIDPASYEIETRSGKLTMLGAYGGPVAVTYSGGYTLPEEAPDALKQAMALLVQAGRTQMAREVTSGIRSISHRESRVQFFDAMAGASGKGGSSSPLSMVGDTVNALLYHYMRFHV